MIQIVAYDPKYRDALLELSIRAWEPVFPMLKNEVSPFVYRAFYVNGWRERQRTDLAEVLDNEPEGIDVALDGDRPVGWVSTRLHPEDSMGEVYVIVVDPDSQRQGVARTLMECSFARAQQAGMTMVMVETGGDSGHAPARAAYESIGFERWPVARYFKDLSD
ncbi:GNAT family N-acetyltransferase [Aeromicrobium sp. 636]|uniref:GNAT family N-acetyltransferase n=1 Tax=Aeromicrobium senzhongii TaxID=2663859 RepID=A0A8I0EY11_9ACTN|nr:MULTISPECIES: GNAT family N-acetyltransferase [Aeromicrobium]MBC9227270.1 GNAT family N-acetyltransferase [Aeromicrobium senzhongii]MCQ3999368.1 GNAT family N-acetyltransferase [Aeromicrobium sp. 636]MTB88320.1 GNAT family N-acetyltransferase [Aeromicrobium senzhongii]QNL94704.1 GNAT family N-acetyltransferase [Aeromicrobium senzhongii]